MTPQLELFRGSTQLQDSSEKETQRQQGSNSVEELQVNRLLSSASVVWRQPSQIEFKTTVPKHLIEIPTGRPLPPDLKELLLRYFQEKELGRLERLGGRIVISLTAPFRRSRAKSENEIVIDSTLVETLRVKSEKPSEIKLLLEKLGNKQLKKLSELLGQPVRSSANGAELRADLIRNIQAEDFWRRISGPSRVDGSTGENCNE